MPFDFYQGPQPDSLNPAYEMLFRAAEARRNALAAIPGEVSGALDQYVKSGQTDRGLQNEANKQADEASYRKGELGIEQQKLDIQRGSHDAFHRAMAHISSLPDGYVHDPGPAGPAFGGRTVSPVARGPVTAESILRGGQSAPGGSMGQPDPADLAAMTPEDASRFYSIKNTMGDNAARDAATQRAQQTSAADVSNYKRTVSEARKGGILTDPEATAFLMTGATPEGRRASEQEIAKRYLTKSDEAGKNATAEATNKALFKQARSDFKDDPEKLGQIAAQETLISNPGLKPDERAAAMQSWSNELYKVGKPKEKDPGVDIPGVGQNINLKTSLKDGGEYMLDKSGNLILPDDKASAELDQIARVSLKDDPAFSNKLQAMLEIQPSAGTEVAWAKGVKDASDSALKGARLRILKSLGNWQEAGSSDPVKAMDPYAAGGTAPQAPPSTQQAPSQTPQAPSPKAEANSSPLSELSPDQTSEAQRLLASGDKAKLREYLIQSRVQNQTKALGSSAPEREWLKANPEPQAWWDMNSGYSEQLKKAGFKSAAAAHKAWEKAKAAGNWGENTPWKGLIGPP